jgi:hypothetical protein
MHARRRCHKPRGSAMVEFLVGADPVAERVRAVTRLRFMSAA